MSGPYIPSTNKGLFAYGLGWILAIGGVILLLSAIGWGISFAWGWMTAGPSGKLQARQQILSGDNRIQAYNHFFDLCASVQTAETAIDSTNAQLALPQSADDKSRLETNLQAQIINRAEAVNQYNQDAAKSYTVGQFRSLALPYSLPTDYQKGAHTTCAS